MWKGWSSLHNNDPNILVNPPKMGWKKKEMDGSEMAKSKDLNPIKMLWVDSSQYQGLVDSYKKDLHEVVSAKGDKTNYQS